MIGKLARSKRFDDKRAMPASEPKFASLTSSSLACTQLRFNEGNHFHDRHRVEDSLLE